MKLTRSIVLVVLAAVLLLSPMNALAQVGVIPIPEEPLDPGRSISLTAADIVGPEARVVGRLELRTFEEGLRVEDMVRMHDRPVRIMPITDPEYKAPGDGIEILPEKDGIERHPEIEAIEDDVIAKAIRKGLRDDRPVRITPITAPEYKALGRVVAFGVVIGPDGVPSWYEGAVNNEAGVAMIHQRAKEWFKEELQSPGRHQSVNPQSVNPQSVNPQSGLPITPPADWIFHGRASRVWAFEPWGVVENTFYLFLSADECRRNGIRRNVFAVGHRMGIEPGINIAGWNSDWRTYRARPRHDWGWGDLNAYLRVLSPDMPQITNPGPKKIAIKIAIYLLGRIAIDLLRWEYQQPPYIRLYPDASIYHAYAAWNQYHTQSEWASKNVVWLEPGSAACVDFFPAGGGLRRLVRIYAEALMTDPIRLWPDRFQVIRHIWEVWIRR